MNKANLKKFAHGLHLVVFWHQGPDSILRWHLTSIANPIVEIRRSYDRLISTMGFPILVRWHLYIETGPSQFYPYPSGLLHKIAPEPVKQSWRIWVCEYSTNKNDNVTTTKQGITKPSVTTFSETFRKLLLIPYVCDGFVIFGENYYYNYLIRYWLLRIVHFELIQEAWIFTPEQPDVWNVVQFHSQSFQSQAKCPANFTLRTSWKTKLTFIWYVIKLLQCNNYEVNEYDVLMKQIWLHNKNQSVQFWEQF